MKQFNHFTVNALTSALDELGMNQAAFSQLSGIDKSAVSFHLRGDRRINHDHLLSYLAALPPEYTAPIHAAWLRDNYPPALLSRLLDFPSDPDARLREEAAVYNPSLREQNADIHWFLQTLATDPDFRWFFDLLKSLGAPSTKL